MSSKEQPDRSRRAGLLAVIVSVLSRPDDTGAREDPGGESAACCGNNSADVYGYGIGQPITPLGPCTSDIQILNPAYGKKNQKSQYAWVFAPNPDVVAIDYVDGNGNHFPPPTPYLNPPGFQGLAWAIAPRFAIVLRWPPNKTPTFSTRPFGASENR